MPGSDEKPASDGREVATADTAGPAAFAQTIASLAPVGTEDTAAPTPFEATMAAGLPRPTSELQKVDPSLYSDRKVLARGGMGQIVTAYDRRLGRTVAIKELRADNTDLRARFEREALLTARLEHPSIVGIHEAGCWPSGEPFYAMKLVTGQPFDKVIASAKTLEERLALVPNVLAVADALAYAHQRRIIHRDLKPQNIVLGEFGETVVIDWGLAKDLAADSADDDRSARGSDSGRSGDVAGETAIGDVLGTPGYMPPEQADGERVDERADVYAIGAILYHVLVGRPAYTGSSLVELLTKVREAAPTPVAELQPSAPSDLCAIVARAMARDRAARYSTARDLAEDLRRFQAGQLVGAHRYSLGQLLRRWVRRNRTAILISSLAAVALLALGIVSVVRVLREQRRTEAQRVLAESRRVNAEKHRAAAEGVVQFMLGDLTPKLESLGKLDLLDSVARKTIAYYEERPPSDERAEQANRALSLDRVAQVLMEKGDEKAALDIARESVAIRQKLADRLPGDVEVQRLLRNAHHDLSHLLENTRDLPAALSELRLALALAQRLAALPGADPDDDTLSVATIQGSISAILVLQGDLGAAEAAARAAYEITSALHSEKPADPTRGRRLVQSDIELAEIAIDRQDWAAATQPLTAAIELAGGLLAKDDRNVELQGLDAWLHSRLGTVRGKQGNVEGAVAAQQIAIEKRERLTQWEPKNVTWQLQLAEAHQVLGTTLAEAGRAAPALSSFASAHALFERAHATDPSSTQALRQLTVSHTTIGDLIVASDPKAAFTHYRAALGLAEELAAKDPKSAQSLAALVMTHTKLGDANASRGDLAAAASSYHKAVDLSASLAALEPDNVGWLEFVTTANYGLGTTLQATNDAAGAIAAYRTCLEIYKRLAARDPSTELYARNIAELHGVIGDVQLAGDAAAALGNYREALAVRDQLAKDHPSPESDVEVAIAHRWIGSALGSSDRSAALAEYTTARDTLRRIAGANPGDAAARTELAKTEKAILDVTRAASTKHRRR